MAKIFEKEGKFSKPSVMLILTWALILIWYSLSGFPFMKDWNLDETLALGLLTAASAYYYGKYNLAMFREEMRKEFREYKKRVKKK